MISMNNQVSFKSRIQFVPFAKFADTIHDAAKIDFGNCYKFVKEDKFFSTEVRTCTGGGFVEPLKNAMGFHILDSEYNNIAVIPWFERFVNFNAENGLLIGAKDLPDEVYKYSMPNLKKIKKYMLSKKINLSVFGPHALRKSQSHFHFSLPDDTWTLCTQYYENNNLKEISSLKDLVFCFKNISISPKDTLFIGDKEITPKDCPSIFNVGKKRNNILNFLCGFFNL